jgi:hypothetical protein
MCIRCLNGTMALFGIRLCSNPDFQYGERCQAFSLDDRARFCLLVIIYELFFYPMGQVRRKEKPRHSIARRHQPDLV